MRRLTQVREQFLSAKIQKYYETSPHILTNGMLSARPIHYLLSTSKLPQVPNVGIQRTWTQSPLQSAALFGPEVRDLTVGKILLPQASHNVISRNHFARIHARVVLPS